MTSAYNRLALIKVNRYQLLVILATMVLSMVVLFQTIGPAQAHSAMIKINKVSSVDGGLLPGSTFQIDPNPYFCYSTIQGTIFEGIYY